MSRRNELTSSDAVFGPFGGLAAALTETAVMTPLTLRLLHARQLHSSSVQADRHLRADLMRHAEAGLIELQHSIHLARQCAKCIVWDKVLGLGSTDALAGAIDQWAGLIIMTYFGKRTFENVARILKR